MRPLAKYVVNPAESPFEPSVREETQRRSAARIITGGETLTLETPKSCKAEIWRRWTGRQEETEGVS